MSQTYLKRLEAQMLTRKFRADFTDLDHRIVLLGVFTFTETTWLCRAFFGQVSPPIIAIENTLGMLDIEERKDFEIIKDEEKYGYLQITRLP